MWFFLLLICVWPLRQPALLVFHLHVNVLSNQAFPIYAYQVVAA